MTKLPLSSIRHFFAGFIVSVPVSACALGSGQHRYITCLDLGAWGALITEGFDRDNVICSGADGKEFKRFINTSVIYPPLDRNAGSILRAAKPPGGGRLAAALTSLLLRSRLTRSSIARRGGSGPAALEEIRKVAAVPGEAIHHRTLSLEPPTRSRVSPQWVPVVRPPETEK